MRKAVVRLQSLRFLSSTSDRQSPPPPLLLPHQFQGEAVTPDIIIIIMPKRKVSRSAACVQYVSDLTSPSLSCVAVCSPPFVCGWCPPYCTPPIITMCDRAHLPNHSAAGCRGRVLLHNPPHHWPCSMTTHGKSREV